MPSTELDRLFVLPDFFVLRTALLPFDAFLNWAEGLEAPHCLEDPARLEEALAADRRRLRERLNAVALRPGVREALFLASADLDEALGRWLEEPDGKKGLRVERTLVRYFSRMCGRSTPFGLFAGYSVGDVGERTHFELDAQQRYRRHTRLDMDYLGALVEVLARDPALQAELIYRPNSSLHRGAGRLRYAESRLRDKRRSYHLVAVDDTDYLLETLARAENGATVSDLAEALVGEEISREEATAYIRELVETQLLVPDLAPKATGPEPIHDVIAQLRLLSSGRVVADRLSEVKDALEAMDPEPPGIDVDRYRQVAARLEELPAKAELSRLFQVDMLKPVSHATLGTAVLEEIARAVNVLHALRPAPPEDDLSRFREAFQARYENREMPLLDVLDEEIGIGFASSRGTAAEPSPLLEGLFFPPGEGERRVPWSALDGYLLDKLQDAARAGSQVLVLDPAELEAFRPKEAPALPDSFSVMAKIAARSPEALDAGDFAVFLSIVGGPAGTNLLGRFCHGDPLLLAHVRDHLRAEESLQPQAIFAEIVHLPEGRMGNVILRPVLREHEIPFLGRSAVPESRQIPVSDLMVSVRGKTVVLRSRRHQKEIIPRLTSAHNFRRGLGLYRFLCSLQAQGTSGTSAWSWGPLEGSRFLPRVVVGKAVLARARWRVRKKELEATFASAGAARFSRFQEWRRERQLPRFVMLVDGDNTLLFDLDNVLSVDTLLELVKGRGEFRLEELYPGPKELCVQGPEGRFVHEVVVPLLRKREAGVADRSTDRPVRTENGTPLRRSFPPGSEWSYVKFYTAGSGADQLLREVISPVVRRAREEGTADGWFFIRFNDPDAHVRVRFHGDPLRLQSELLPRLHAQCAPLLASGLVWKTQLETYEREIERYGQGEDMLLSERLFQADSEACLDILESFSSASFADARWRLTLRGMDDLLDDLGFDPEGKHAILSGLRRSFLEEVRAGASFQHQLGDRFRKERASLEALLDRTKDASSPLARPLRAFRMRSEKLRPIAAALRTMAEDGRLSVPLASLAGSYLHMHANRMLRSAQRSQEVVLYDFLTRLYESQRARAGKGGRRPGIMGSS